MYRILMIAIALLFVISTNQQSHAQSKETFDSMIACLHETPLSTENADLDADGDAFYQCISKVAEECIDLDRPGGFGDEELTAGNCYLSVAVQIKSKMYSHLENGWPEKNSTAYQLRKIAIDYGIKRSELYCEFEDALNNIGNIIDLKSKNKFLAQCLFGYIATNYWTIIVHERLR